MHISDRIATYMSVYLEYTIGCKYPITNTHYKLQGPF